MKKFINEEVLTNNKMIKNNKIELQTRILSSLQTVVKLNGSGIKA